MGEQRADERVALLAEVAAALSSAASVADVARALTGCLVPALCDACEVVLAVDEDLLSAPADGTASVEGSDRRRRVALDGRTGRLGHVVLDLGGRRTSDDEVALLTSIARLAALAIENVQALVRERSLAERLRQASNVATALNLATDVEQIGYAVVELARRELGATTALLYLLAADDLHVVASSGYDAERLESWRTMSLEIAAPVPDACRDAEVVVCRSFDEIVARYPYVLDVKGFDEQSFIASPLLVTGGVLGGAFWSFDRSRAFGEDEQHFVELVSEHVGAAVARLRAADSEAAYAERMHVQSVELFDSRARLAALGDAEVIGIAVGRGPVIAEANGMFLDLLGLTSDALVDGLDPATLTPPEWRALDSAMRTRMRSSGRMEPFEEEFLHADGSRVPVLVGGARLRTDPFEWIVFVLDLRALRSAERAAERANDRLVELLAEQRRIADVLQASLLPGSLPEIEGLEVHAQHWAEAPGGRVGGDFYDVFELGPGRWGVLIGDVCGKGVEAAAITATARHTARAAAMHLRFPDAVLHWVHEAVAAHPMTTFCTVAFAVLEADGAGGFRADVSLGGHPPGLVCHVDGVVERLGVPGTLLGIMPPKLSTTQHRLQPGDVVLFYTDGITDAPEGEALTEPELTEWLSAHRELAPHEVARALRAELSRRRPSGPRDDVAVVVLRLAG